MSDQTPERRPISAKVAGIQALGRARSAANPNAAEEQRRRQAETDAAQEELLEAFKAAGFKVTAPAPSLARPGVGIECGPEAALELAAWLRAQPSVKKPQRK